MKHFYLGVMLNLFDGNGAGATASSTSGSADADSGAATGTASSDKTIRPEIRAQGQKLGLSDDLLKDYQQAYDSRQPKEAQEKSTEETKEQDTTAEFDNLIKGKYKAEFDNVAQTLIKDRLKNTNKQISDLKQKIEADDEIFNLLSRKYKGVDVNNRQALYEAVKNDDDVYTQAALDGGMTVDDAKKAYDEEIRQRKQQEELESLRREKATRDLDARFQKLAAETQQKYPGFNLQSEMENPSFRSALDFIAQHNRQLNQQNGTNAEIFDITRAYEMAHFDDLQERTVHTVGKAAMSAFAQNVAANGARPTENVNSSGKQTAKAKSISEMTDEEFDALYNAVKDGKARIPRG